MTEEEKRRRLQAYALQNFTGQLKVQDTPQAPKVTVAAPQPQQQIRQAQPTQFRAEVTTPYRKENFVANQPQPQTGAMSFLGRNTQPIVKSVLGTNQQGDNRNFLSKAWDQVNQMDSGRSFRQNTPTTKDSGLTQYGKAVMGPLAGVQLRGFRTIGGAAEGASGLVDWVTPGTGTSRVTQGISKFNANLDKTAKDVGGSGAYNITAVPSEVASFFVPSKAIATGASYIPKAAKLISTVDKGLNKFGSKFGKVGKAITGTFRPTEIGTEAAITGKYIGEDVSKGKEITPQRVLTDITTGVGGDSIVRVINSLRRLKIKNVDDLALEKDAGKIEEAIIRDAPEIPADKAKDISIKLAEADTPEKVTGVLAAAKTDLATPTAQAVPTQTPDVPPTQAIQPEVIKNLTVNKTPEQVKVAVKALYPKLDDVSLEAVSQRIAKSTNDKEVEQTLLEASRRSENVTTAVDNAVAPKVPEQTLEQAVEPQTAPQTIQTPEAPITQTTQPNIPGATTADNVPNTAPIEKTPVEQAVPEAAAVDATKYDNPTKYLDARLRQIKDKSQQLKDYLRIYKLGSTEAGQNSPEYTKLVDEYKTKYGDTEAPEVTQIMDDFNASRQPVDVTADPVKQSFLSRVSEKGKDLWQKTKEQVYDPWIEWDKISNKITKNMGLKRKDADPLFNLPDLINKRVTVSQVADRVLLAKNNTGQSVAEVFAKYPDVDVAKGLQDNAFVRYLHARFFLEIYEKSGGKIWKGQGYTPDDAARSVADFEAQNPTARLDADTIKAWQDNWVDYKAASGKEMTAEHANNLKNAYSVYVPLERAPTPDLISPTFSGGRGGVGTEKIAQNITEVAGNYDTSLASIKNRNLRYAQESTDNDILLALDEANRKKYIGEDDDVYIAIDPEKVEQREAVVSRLEETRAKIDELKKQRNKANRQTKNAKAKLKQAEASAKNIVRSEKQKEYAKTVEKLRAGIDKAKVKLKVQKAKLGLPQYRTQQAETKAVTAARNELLKTVSDPDAKAVISKMTKDDLIDVFQAMADDAPIQAGVWGRLKKLNVTRKQYNKLVDDITGQRQAILIAKQQLSDFVGDNKNIGAIGKMSDDEIIDALDIISSKDVKSAEDASERLRAKGGFYKELSDQLQATRDELDIKKAEAAGDWAEAARLNQVKPQYENLVPYYKNGYKGYMHVNKNMASEMNSMRTAANPNIVEKVARGISNAQKWVFTGGGAPVFRMVTNPIRNVTHMAVLGRGLSAFGAKPMAAGAKSVFTAAEKDAYTQRLVDYGLRLELATKTPTARNTGVKELASRTSKTGRLKYLAKNPGELYRTLNSGLAKLDNAARIQVAKGAELNARRRHPDWSEDQIMSFAASEGNNVLGNFNRVSRLARDAEVVNNYSGATQTGFRQLMKTFRERPIETGAKVVSLVGSVAGITGYMLAGAGLSDDYKETMKEYYDQQIASGNTNELDSNIIIGIPGKVKYDEATNTWTGIIKKPLPPDYKPLIRASWRTAYDVVSNKTFNPALIGKELANFATADQASNIKDPKTGVWLPNSPIFDVGRIVMGQDPTTGKPLTTEQEKYAPRTEQYNKYTSDLAKFFSKATNGALTPIQINAIFSQSGYFGTKLKSVETEAEKNMGILESVAKDFTSKVYGSRGFGEKQQEGKEFATRMDELYKKYNFDENEFNKSKVLYPVKKDKDGKDIKPKGYYVGATKAGILADSLSTGDTDLWEFAKEVSKINREPGDPVDPLYELDNNQAQQVLALMAQPNPQNMDNKIIRKQNPWIKDFYTKRAEFFDKIIERQKTNYEKDVEMGLMSEDELAEIKSNVGKDWLGVTVPKMTPEVKTLQAQYDELKKGEDAGARFQFMKDNPDLQQYYDDKNEYDRFKRTAMRLPLLDEYPKASPKVQSIQDEYNAIPKGNGPVSKYTGQPTSPDRSAWFKANPEKAALLTEQWYKQNLFDLQGAAALATYEGESLDEDAFSDMKKITEYRDKLDGGTGSSGYSGYSKFGYSKSSKKGSKSGSSGSDTAEKPARTYAAQLLSGLPTDFTKTPNIDTTPKKVKFKVKTPSGKGRNYKRIRLQ